MDRRTILAIILSALVLILVPLMLERLGLTPRRAPARPQVGAGGESQPGRAGDTTGRNPQTSVAGATSDTSATRGSGRASSFASVLGAPEKRVSANTGQYQAQFDTRGAKLVAVTLDRIKSAGGGPVMLEGKPTLALDLGAPDAPPLLADAIYDVSESTDAQAHARRLRFTAADTSGLRVLQTYTLDPDQHVLDLEVQMDGVVARGISQYHLTVQSWPLITERNVQEDLNNLQAVSLVGKDVRRHRWNDLRKGPRVYEGAIRWTAVRSKYFSVAVVPKGASSNAVRSYFLPGSPAATATSSRDSSSISPDHPLVGSSLVLPVPPPGTSHHFRIYAGPNDYWALSKIGDHLEDVVDLGWRWLLPFSRAILKLMVFVHRFVPNYGLVILLLSLLVKVVFHPLTASSMKSMRAMQRIQPEIEKLRKRHEKDPQKLNQAVFELYKQNKVNPFGGCLPLVIQMPVLFALYQVFLHAIELRQAPFLLWIDDLSAPDVLFHVAGFPIRVLPVIMYFSAWLQQRMTPTDPRQVMTMHLMNLFLLVVFYNLPSGLVLYWTVTNLLTAAQQYLVTHGEKPSAAKAA